MKIDQKIMMEQIPLSETKALTSRDLKRLRHHAAHVFESLERQVKTAIDNDNDDVIDDDVHESPPSWVSDGDGDGDGGCSCSNKEEQSRKLYFDSHGFFVARDFCNAEETLKLKQAMTESVRNHWFQGGGNGEEKDEGVTSFGTDAKSNEARGDPFLESADKVSYFAEPTALDSETGNLKPEFVDDKKIFALCKAGHGLHLPPSYHGGAAGGTAGAGGTENDNDNEKNKNIHEPFFEYATSAKLRELVLSLGYQDPVVPQSMYIFKNPVVGGAVHSHQDSTFLYTTPKQTCLGLWLALDDATLDNGCLWVRPKSHFEPLRRQFIRNPKYNNTDDDDNNNNNDDKNEPKLTFRCHHDDPKMTWEGALPKSVDVIADGDGDDDGDVGDGDNRHDGCNKDQDGVSSSSSSPSSLNFVPVEVKAGDLVVFCGTLDHFSLPNFSDQQRHTFQLHLVEGSNAGVVWSPENWLQYDDDEQQQNSTTTADAAADNGSIKFLRLLDYAD